MGSSSRPIATGQSVGRVCMAVFPLMAGKADFVDARRSKQVQREGSINQPLLPSTGAVQVAQ
jgi:hypothetical protein